MTRDVDNLSDIVMFCRTGNFVICDVSVSCGVVVRWPKREVLKKRREPFCALFGLAILHAFDDACEDWLKTILLQKVTYNNHIGAGS